MALKKPKVEKPEKSEMEILHPVIQVAGYQVKPWSFDQFFDLLPVFLQGSEILKESGISLKDLEKLGTENDAKKILSVLSSFRPIIPKLIGVTLGIKTEEVGKIDFDKVISIALVIMIQNAERIKNFSGLGKTAMQVLITS